MQHLKYSPEGYAQIKVHLSVSISPSLMVTVFHFLREMQILPKNYINQLKRLIEVDAFRIDGQ